MKPLYSAASFALAVTLLSGCAMRQPHAPQQSSAPVNATATPPVGPESLSDYMQKVRHLSANARPLNKNEAVETLETRDPAIAAEVEKFRTAFAIETVGASGSRVMPPSEVHMAIG